MSPILSPASVTCVRRPYSVRGSGIQKTPIISAFGVTSKKAVGRLMVVERRPRAGSGRAAPARAGSRARIAAPKTSSLSLTAPMATGRAECLQDQQHAAEIRLSPREARQHADAITARRSAAPASSVMSSVMDEQPVGTAAGRGSAVDPSSRRVARCRPARRATSSGYRSPCVEAAVEAVALDLKGAGGGHGCVDGIGRGC